MTKTNVVFEQELDAELMAEIVMLRHARVEHYEGLLDDLRSTSKSLAERGVESNEFELKREIDQKLVELKERLHKPDTIFADEIELYVDLMD